MSTSRYAADHASPSGPGDARPTAAQVIDDDSLVAALRGKTILVTGGSSGLGVDIVRQLARTGAKVYFTSRDLAKGAKLKEDLEREASEEGREIDVEVLEMELGDLGSVKRAAEEFKGKSQGLNVLVNNAGTFFLLRGDLECCAAGQRSSQASASHRKAARRTAGRRTLVSTILHTSTSSSCSNRCC